VSGDGCIYIFKTSEHIYKNISQKINTDKKSTNENEIKISDLEKIKKNEVEEKVSFIGSDKSNDDNVEKLINEDI
jgi:hypothetical protein